MGCAMASLEVLRRENTEREIQNENESESGNTEREIQSENERRERRKKQSSKPRSRSVSHSVKRGIARSLRSLAIPNWGTFKSPQYLLRRYFFISANPD